MLNFFVNAVNSGEKGNYFGEVFEKNFYGMVVRG